MEKTKIAVEVFDKSANLYRDKFMDLSLYHDTFDLFCDSIVKQHADILELACGPGNVTKYLLQKRPDFNILGTDLSPNMLSLAKIDNPSAEFQRMDMRDMLKLNKKYDGIICGFGLPYLSKEEAVQLISDAAIILNPNGMLYLSTMEDEYSKSGFKKGSTGDELFIHYHQADYLTDALKENGFQLIDIQHIDFTESDGTTSIDIVLIARK